jgi:HEAT repeat protein
MTNLDWAMSERMTRDTRRSTMKRAILLTLGVVLAASGAVMPVAGAPFAAAVPTLRAPQEDPAGRLYREAREMLNSQRYRDAAQQFARLRGTYPSSAYVPDSFYWQAFALYQEDGAGNLRAASDLLRSQRDLHPSAATRADAEQLLVRIEGRLAQRGDAGAAATISQQAAGPCNGNQDVRAAALSALMNMNANQAVPILQEVLRQRDACSVELRRQAVFLIAQQLNDESVDILLDLAHRNPDPDAEVREQAVFWLHEVRTPEALAALRAILEESTDQELQEAALFSISQRRDPGAMEVLRGYAERSDVPNELRENAIFWIGQSSSAGGTQYLMELYDRLDSEELKESAIFGIAQSSDAAARAWLLERAMDVQEPMELRENALFWAGQTGALDAAALGRIYRTVTEAEMKEQAIFVASQDGSTEMVDFLMEIARTEQDAELRENAIFWLGQTNDPRVPEFLLGLIRGGE